MPTTCDKFSIQNHATHHGHLTVPAPQIHMQGAHSRHKCGNQVTLQRVYVVRVANRIKIARYEKTVWRPYSHEIKRVPYASQDRPRYMESVQKSLQKSSRQGKRNRTKRLCNEVTSSLFIDYPIITALRRTSEKPWKKSKATNGSN